MKFDTDYVAETKRLENEVKNAKAQQTRILNNKQALAVDEKGVKIDAPKVVEDLKIQYLVVVVEVTV